MTPSRSIGHGLFALCLGLLATSPALASLTEIQAQLVVERLNQPVFVTAPAGDARLFVVEKPGRVLIVRDGVVNARPFLDLRSRINSANVDQGLFSIAFAPDYATTGLFYALFTDRSGDSVLSRFAVSADPDRADPAEEVLLTIEQPFVGNNGGTVAFGPDGFLHLSAGDGGSTGDPDDRAQDPGDLLGKLLRIDVALPPAPDSIPVAGGSYAIPASNPFVGVAGARAEIFALGLQNPRRFSFDRLTGDLWIADIGIASQEVNHAAAGASGSNFGWDVEEGAGCNAQDPAPAPPCGDPALTPPVLAYPSVGGDCAITGGFVHRGGAVAVQGHYLFGDYCTGRISSFDPATGIETDRTLELGAAGNSSFELMGFGEDGLGNQYVVLRGLLLRSGKVFRIAAAPPECGDGIDNDGDGTVDGADPGCLHGQWPEEDPLCSNGRDDDGDGRVDTEDPGCGGRPWWIAEGTESLAPGRSCGLFGSEALLIPLLLSARRRRARPVA